MAKLLKKKDYYYLQKAFRENSKVFVREEYLGKEIPKNIKQLKEEFDVGIRKERFEKDILNIQNKYQKELEKMPATVKKKYFSNFAVQFTYNSQAIEGSTLSFMDTRLLINDGISPLKPIKDVDESLEHHKLFMEMLEYKNDLSSSLALFWHKRLFEKTYPQIAGKIRPHNIAVAGSKTIFPDHIEVEYLLEEFFSWYKRNKDKYNPVELAALVHLKFVLIHPFSDGNGRMSRLLMNYILYKNNYPLVDISYSTRRAYYNALEKSNLKEDSNYFIEFIIKKYLKDYSKNII